MPAADTHGAALFSEISAPYMHIHEHSLDFWMVECMRNVSNDLREQLQTQQASELAHFVFGIV